MAETQIIITARDEASKVFRSLAMMSNDLTAGLKGLGLTLAGVLSSERVISMVAETVKAQDAMGKLAQATGLSVESISAYSYAAQISGSNTQALSTGVRALSKSIIEAQRAGSDAAVVFKSIGVATKDADGRLRSTEAILGDIADRFASYEDGPAKVDLATRLFGRGGNELIPLLNQGSAGLARMSEEARKAGVVLSSDMAASAARVNDGWERMTASAEGVKNTVVASLLPALEAFNDIMERSSAASGGLSEKLGFLDTSVRVVASGLNIVKNVGEGLFEIGRHIGFGMMGDEAGQKSAVKGLMQDFKDIEVAQTRLWGPQPAKEALPKVAKGAVPDIATDAADKIAKASKLRLEALAARDALVQLDLKAQATAASLAGDVATAESLNRQAESLKNLATVQRELLRIEEERVQLQTSGKATPEALKALDAQAAALKAQVPIYEKLTVLASELAEIQERARLREQASAHGSAMAGFTGGLGVWDARRQGIVSKYDTLRENPATKGFKDDWDTEQAAALAQVGREQALAASQASEAYARMRGDVAGMAQAQMEQLDIERQLATTEEQRALLTAQIAEAQARRDGDMAAGAQKGFREYASSATDAFGQAESAAVSCFSTMSDGLSRTIVMGDSLGNTLQNLSLRLTSMMLDMQLLGPMAKVLGGASLSEAGGWLSIFSAKGNVFQSADLASLSGRIVTRPTVFGFDRHLTPFAKGGGVMGEAGPEAVLKLYRANDGVLGVKGKVDGGSGTYVFSPNLTVNAPPSSGNQARDDAYIKALTNTMTKGLESAFNDMLDKAMRPGGKLNQGTSL